MNNLRKEFFKFDISREKLYYFAHPYSGDEENNFKLANERTVELMKLGYNIFSPITYSHLLDVKHKDLFKAIDWLKLDKIFLDRCEGIIMAPGWDKSKGCMLEYEYAVRNDKEILFYKEIFAINN